MNDTKQNSNTIFKRGVEMLDSNMTAHGFRYVADSRGRSSGGDFASGKCVNSERSLEIHFRHELGLVTYRFGADSLRHEVFMRALLGKQGGNKYPGFSNAPLDAFENLRYDLEKFGAPFLNGDKEIFRQCVEEARRARKLSGLERMEQNWPTAIDEIS